MDKVGINIIIEKKMLFVGIILILIAFSAGYFIGQIVQKEKFSSSLKVCIEAEKARRKGLEREGLPLDLYPGIVTVEFEEGVLESEAMNIIMSYGLSFREYSLGKTLNTISGEVLVKEGSEIEWACRLKENPKIKFAAQSSYAVAQ